MHMAYFHLSVSVTEEKVVYALLCPESRPSAKLLLLLSLLNSPKLTLRDSRRNPSTRDIALTRSLVPVMFQSTSLPHLCSTTVTKQVTRLAVLATQPSLIPRFPCFGWRSVTPSTPLCGESFACCCVAQLACSGLMRRAWCTPVSPIRLSVLSRRGLLLSRAVWLRHAPPAVWTAPVTPTP